VSRYRWTVLALGTAAQASYSAAFLGIPVLAPALRAEYGLTLAEVGVVLAAFSLGSVLTLLPWGLLTDRVGERSVLATGLVAASAALAAAAFAGGYVALVVLLLVAGGAGASVNAASGRAVMGWVLGRGSRLCARDPADGAAAGRSRRGPRAAADRKRRRDGSRAARARGRMPRHRRRGRGRAA
jgi:MFS family permease